ncbi:MAG: helix-turn-helix protein [Actinomycetota bacterium]|nr:helix-turn-helix protein [Actinomycetota bacterium]
MTGGVVARAIAITEAGARELVSALDELDRLARPDRQLSASLAAIRRELAACTSRVVTSADISAEAIGALGDPHWPTMMDTTTAATELGITRDGVTWLCRRKHLHATRLNGRWLVDTSSLLSYRIQREQRLSERSL